MICVDLCRIKAFPKEELLWRELRKLIQSQETSSSELDLETKFLRGTGVNFSELHLCLCLEFSEVISQCYMFILIA